MDKPKFNYGDYVFHASIQGSSDWVPCPDCNGKGYVKIVYEDETFTLDCEGCARGYMGSTGLHERYTYAPTIREGIIEGVEKDSSAPYEFEYRLRAGGESFWILKESDVFLTREEAEARAQVLKQEKDEEESKRVFEKIKPNKSWAWHVKYYKDQIRTAQKQIEYATLQLNAAQKKAKEPNVSN